ncbi:glycosyltransferase N-terminal domain-containing protein [uncultured Psychroserpens sp.]|uniref:3-deoxy-D-manno-octulosonic acid transferase n=1 Tax=uncultured Psychroserpens sp. TaxID=255436 RepID=UPI00262EBA8C|nr:glycosyltransferase N-terminal domain-containing protein [uncultured Psychroserpens sp.]
MYTTGIYVVSLFLKVLALFNTKIKLGVNGRKQTFNILEEKIDTNDKTIWFHCASLGEYEQGLPVFEVLRKNYPNHKIVLTFFSPSGYEIRKNTTLADVVVYLPLDTRVNAKHFLKLVHPEFTVFVKYDIWPNLLHELKRQDRRAILISALFRKNQSYFKSYGGKRQSALFSFEHIFVQDENSKTLLNSINYNSVTISGDTRFDRVSNQLSQINTLDFVTEFKSDSTCVVIGSSWPEDEDILIPYINNNASKDLKFIIAPHEIKNSHVKAILSKLKVTTVLFSKKQGKDLNDASVLIIDTIGLLSKVYSYADIAYVGGAMGQTGLHNILEPAVFGIPIIIGKNHQKFPEAFSMIEHAGVTSVKSEKDLKTVFDAFISSKEYCTSEGLKNSAFINKNKGAVVQIANYIRI